MSTHPHHKKKAAAPAQARGFLRQAVAAAFCGVSRDTLHRADQLYRRSGGRFGLRARKAGRCVLFAVEDLAAWIEAGMPTGVHRDSDGKIRMTEFEPQTTPTL